MRGSYFALIAALVSLGTIAAFFLVPRHGVKIKPSVKNIPVLQVGMPHIPDFLDPAKIRSVSQYIAMAHVGRSLIQMTKDAQVEGDLAKSWDIQDDFKKYQFRIHEGEKFSDGTPITLQHIECSFNRQKRLKSAIHFDFESIKAIRIIGGQIEIELSKSNPRFLQQMAHPEFSVLTLKNCEQPLEEVDLSIASGPYFVSRKSGDILELSKNPHFPAQSPPEKVQIHGKNLEELNQMLIEDQFDFCLGTGRLDHSRVQELEAKYQIRTEVPHIGFTFWLSINEFNEDLKDLNLRQSLMKWIHGKVQISEDSQPYWSKADQMYLPDGNGRLTPAEVDKIWSDIDKASTPWPSGLTLHLLMRKNFKFESEIEKALKEQGVKIHIDYYSSLKEFEDLSRDNRKKYHLIQINNDYSAVDLFENLKVTFNPVRPLVFADESAAPIQEFMDRAKIARDINEAYDQYRAIEELLLTRGLIIPLAYNHLVYFVSDRISIKEWSTLYPEVSFWKIKPRSSN